MKKAPFLREYPTNDEPRIFSAKSWNYDESLISSYKKEVFEFFQSKLGLNTIRKSIKGNEYVEGSFLDVNKRTVTLRFLIHKGPYRNVMIEGDPIVHDIRIFKSLYRQSPFIKD